MIEVRIHGRAGLGTLDMTWLLSHAGRQRGWEVHASPEPGDERRGTPLVAWVRLDAQHAHRNLPVVRPTHVVVLDASLVPGVPVAAALGADATLLLNAPAPRFPHLVEGAWSFAWVDASGLAREHHLGTAAEPQVAAPMLGAYAALSGVLTVAELTDVMDAAYPANADRHARAALQAFAAVRCLPGGGALSRGPRDAP